MFSIRRVLAAGMLLLAGSASPTFAAPAKVTIGFPPATDFLAAYVAKDKGFFAKHDIDAKMTLIPVVNNIPSAIVSGSVQIGMSTIPTFLQAVDGGLDLKLIAGAARHTKAHPFISLLARTGVKYAKPSDLIGKKVGVPGINSVIDVMLRKWLNNKKVPVNKVKIIEAPLPQLPNVLNSGNIDYVAIVEPFRTKIVATHSGTIAAEYFAEVNPDVLVSCWIAGGDWADKNPQVVDNFRAAINDGLEFISKNPAEAREIEKKYIHYNSPSFPTFNNKARPEDLTFFLKLGDELHLYRHKLDPKKLVVP
jgi:NitT/TauT family transport system substrate-binding protein